MGNGENKKSKCVNIIGWHGGRERGERRATKGGQAKRGEVSDVKEVLERVWNREGENMGV